jgi:hypothetical protein
MERCESGRIGLTANELTRETLSEGSNPSLSAHNLSLASSRLHFAGLIFTNKMAHMG